MPNKTLYIPERDVPLWDAAQRIAKRKKVSLYRVLTEALENHLPTAANEPDPQDKWAHIVSTDATAETTR